VERQRPGCDEGSGGSRQLPVAYQAFFNGLDQLTDTGEGCPGIKRIALGLRALRKEGRAIKRWLARFSAGAIRTLRESLERLVGEPAAALSPLFDGLEPQPNGWRASVRKPDTLPPYPRVLHRGGFPDGS